MHRLPRTLVQRNLRFAHRPVSRIQTRWATQDFARPGTGPLRYQAVRINKPGFFTNRQVTFRRILSFFIYGGATYIYFGLVASRFDVGLDEDDDGEEEEEEKSHLETTGNDAVGEAAGQEGPPFYADENSMFIPMTFAKKLPRSFYRGSDPEWQEFMKFAKDKTRRDRARQDLADRVLVAVTRHPQLKQIVGEKPKIGSRWVEFNFPDGPPQEYERSGIEIGDGFIAWSQQKVDSEAIFRLTRALWPTAAVGSLWNATSVLAGIQYRRVKQIMGLEDKDPKSPEERYRVVMEMLAKQQHAKDRKPLDKTPSEVDGTGSSSSIASPQSKGGANDTKRFPWQIPVPMPNEAASGSLDVSVATHVFRAALAKAWTNKNKEPPRGTCVVTGLIEVRGDDGRVIIDARGYYEPKTSHYVDANMGLRSISQYKQGPKGGP